MFDAHDEVPPRGDQVPGAADEHERLDEPRSQPARPRRSIDYVDDHFYVDHPSSSRSDWQLPSRCDNANPVQQGAPGGRGGNTRPALRQTFHGQRVQLLRARPVPRRWRHPDWRDGRAAGLGRDLALRLLPQQRQPVQAHAPWATSTWPPIRSNQAADRAAVMLYLRGDLKPAPHRWRWCSRLTELENLPKKVPTMGRGPELGHLDHAAGQRGGG